MNGCLHFFLFEDLKGGLSNKARAFYPNWLVSDKGEREIFIFLQLYFYKIDSLLGIQK